MKATGNRQLVYLITIPFALLPLLFNLFYYQIHHNKILQERESLYESTPEREALMSYVKNYLVLEQHNKQLDIWKKKVSYSEEYYRLRRKIANIKRVVTTYPIDLEDPLIKQYLAEYRELVEQGVIEER